MNHQKVIKRKKPETKRSKFMYKYSQLKRFFYDRQLQVYMYAFMYVDPDTMPEEKKTPDTKKMLQTTRKCQIQDQSQKIVLGLVTQV